MNNNRLLRVAGYLSIGLAVLIFFLLEYPDNLWGSVPFFINTYYVFRFLTGRYRSQESMVAYSAIMFLLNLYASLNEGGWLDTMVWAAFIFVWYRAEVVTLAVESKPVVETERL